MDIRAIELAYKRYAGVYDIAFGAVFQPGRRAIMERMDCRSGDHVLEVGVGTGLSLPLYPRDVLITGIDISAEMLAKARFRVNRERLANVVRLLVMDAEKMNFEDGVFDKVVAMHVASVVPHPAQLVSEMRRVCKPGGQIIFVNHFNSNNPVMGSFERMIAPLSRLLGFRPDFSLENFMREAGLDDPGISQVNLLNFCTMLEFRNLSQESQEGIGAGDAS